MRYRAILFTLLISTAAPAFAHAMLLDSNPAADTTVAPPASISLTFSEELASAADITLKRDGAPVTLDGITLASNYSVVTVKPKASLLPGKYVLTWHDVARDDGHKASGSIDFTVK